MTAEERTEYFRKLSSLRKRCGAKGIAAKPRGLTVAQYEARLAEQKPIIQRIIKKMADQGQLPDDPRAVEALEKTMVILRTQEDAKSKLAAARLILDFTKAKPTTKIEHTVKTAEDYLDELAEDD
jgi:hypothetical protein